MKLPPFSGLKALETVARCRSIRKAANELLVDHSVVSRQLRSLQSNLGVELITTSRAGAELTEAGRDYARVLSAAFGEIAAATEALRIGAAARKLIVMSAPAFASKWLIPRLSDFRRRHGGVDIVLKTTSLSQDLRSFDADILIQLVAAPEAAQPGTVTIARPRAFPIAHRDFLRAHPQFSTPQSLVDAPLIHEINLDRWAKWFLACGIPVSKPLSGPRIGQAHLVVEAARQGYGVALSNAIIGATDLQEGELCEIGATDVYLGSYMMTVTRAAQNRRATMQFQKWLLSCAGGFAPAQGRVPS